MHSIELSFKAFMCSRGMTIGELSKRKYGHNIKACYRKARELGLLCDLEIGLSDLRAIVMLMKLDAGPAHALRYIKTGHKRFPSWAIVEPLAVRLHQVVSVLVGYGKTVDTHYPTLNPDVASSQADPSLQVTGPKALARVRHASNELDLAGGHWPDGPSPQLQAPAQLQRELALVHGVEVDPGRAA
jgi:hypothetical protein